MSDPINGDSQIDDDMRKILARVTEIDTNICKNLSDDILGPMVAEFMRVAGLAQQHYIIKTKQSIGALKDELKRKGII